ncbi:hypothetical protein [Thiorhodospira sibirica]|uniref:hypothetical protein n=1 Tax=Thiorhodospira sibirica TaxID=154347 RepID=UPI00111267C9|nr:hypothetical protein [Thiorhodospira sibirica]
MLDLFHSKNQPTSVSTESIPLNSFKKKYRAEINNNMGNEFNVLTRVVLLKPGMYIFRYATKLEDGVFIPVTLQAAPLGKGSVDFFPADGVTKNTLRSLGDCIIVRVKGYDAGVLVAEYHVGSAAQQEQINIYIDRIDTSERLLERNTEGQKKTEENKGYQSSAPYPSMEHSQHRFPQVASFTPSKNDIRLSGHVELQGDVVITNGWLGHPENVTRIEGFSVEWLGRPQDADLIYTCYSKGIGQSPAVASGSFVGTRGKATPITSVSFALAGSRAGDYELSGYACFAGCPPVPVEAGKKLSGLRETEQLTALSIRIRDKKGEAAMSRSPSPWDDPEVTQIFRVND